jgi:probable addiction module antidote protein
MTELTNFDPAEYLDSPEAIAAYIEDALNDDDANALPRALGVVARAKGMSAIAAETGLGRESLYKALSETGDPRSSTLRKVLGSLGLRIAVTPI